MDRPPTRRKVLGLTLLLATACGWPARANGACRLAVLGDSLTAGYGLAREAAFPARLQEALAGIGLACSVLDAGVSGDTSAGGAARIGWVLEERPTHLLVELGGNDALRALPPAQLEANLRRIVETALERGVAVMLAGMRAPPNLGPEYALEFEQVYERLAQRYGIPLYPFFLDGVAGRPELLQPDGIHPTAAGVEVIVSRILPSLERWLRQTASSTPD